jgi:hypothetical protein
MKIAVLDDYQGVALGLANWDRLDAEITVFRDTIGGPALVEGLVPFDVVCLMRERTPFSGLLIAALPRLRLIVTSGRRNASIDIAAAAAHSVAVCGTDSRAPVTAQMAMALILAVPADKAYFYPEGVDGLFEIYYAPADTFETVNTLGLPLYARATPTASATSGCGWRSRAIRCRSAPGRRCCARRGGLDRLRRGGRRALRRSEPRPLGEL